MTDDTMRKRFETIAHIVQDALAPGEVFTGYFAAEDSDFVRLNHNRVRQAGHVRQIEFTLDLIADERHATGEVNLSGDADLDRTTLNALIETLRIQRTPLEPDPYLLYAREVHSSEESRNTAPVEVGRALGDIQRAADGLDLVGIWASGVQYRGFANSFGQRNWYVNASFNFDWSCYLEGDRAVKRTYAGLDWDDLALAQAMAKVRTELQALALPRRALTPGQYRVYLAPAALAEILGILGWGGFGLKAHRTRQSPLLRLAEGEHPLHPQITLVENHAGGLTPGFTAEGFLKPKAITLIEQGRFKDYLVSPRSSREYAASVNADSEYPASLELSAGTLALDEVLAQLDTGLYLNNLWYLNYSDYTSARITGMTRYACFWVEGGKLQAPIQVMRFDDSVYRMLGEHLIGLTQARERFFDPDTYSRRSTASLHLPGALIEDFAFTL